MRAIPLIVTVLAMAAGCGARQDAVAPQSATPTSSAPAATAGPSVPVKPPTSAAAAPFPVRFKGEDVSRIPTTNKVAALTFDAGSNVDGMASIVATLRREGVPATFFLTGDFVQRYPSASKSLADFRIGNHTMTHPHLPSLSDAQVRAELTDAQGQIRAVVARDPRPLMRFPYGDRDSRTIALANTLGYVAVRWTVDSLGWQGTQKHTAASVANRVLAAAQPGLIVLMHTGSNPDDHSTLDADALPAIIDGLRAKGYSFVTLDALLNI